ncbi:hypothetical protein COLO4_23656 [Corchorus olitorius]|uniref:At1g61320/AtMIF1 LRR domain-containing protein n=1 Tax=Corchorus olitorius TaxID=93759 RepID=A0A1R3IFJ1_9ROSI|nr:hypothetical protein COLO4_23656 [Corchorus olitorius]
MSCLNFDADTFFLSGSKRGYSSREEHVKSVYKLLLQHYWDSKIESFRLWVPDYYPWLYIDDMIMDEVRKERPKDYDQIGDDDHNASYIWIRSAIQMGAEELNFIYADNVRYIEKTFSFEIILSGLLTSKLKHLRLQKCSIAKASNDIHDQPILHSLATLELDDVPVDETALGSIFFTCVNLWKLVLRKCKFPPNLTIVGPINLKCLQIFSPVKLNKLQVSAAKLTYFEYQSTSLITKLSFSNVPKLEEMLLNIQPANQKVDDMFTDFATDAPQLKRLMSLHTTLDFKLEPRIPVTSTILCQLEQLELILGDWKYCNLLKMIPILVACPLLQKFQLIASGRPTNVPDMQYPSNKHPFPNLKEVQIRTFYASSSEIPFVFYMLENAVALDRMILDTTPKSCRDCKIKNLAHELPNHQIRAKVASPTAKLVFQHHSNERIYFAKIFIR